MNGSVHKLGSRQFLNMVLPFRLQTKHKKNAFWDCKRTFNCSVGGLRVLNKQQRNTCVAPSAWMDRVLGGRSVSCLDSRPVSYPSVLLGLSSPWWMEMEKPHTTAGGSRRRNSTTNTSFFFTTVLQVCHHPDKKMKILNA